MTLGGMLSIADKHLNDNNPDARLTTFGQELNDESYAICKADMLINGHPRRTFDYMLSDSPFGVERKEVEKEVRKEHEDKGQAGRFSRQVLC